MREVDEDKLLKGITHHLNYQWANKCLRCPYYSDDLSVSCREEILKDVLAYLNGQMWYGADKRPPSEGNYLVYGLTNFVPDHSDMPNGYWEIKIGTWDSRYGWLDLKRGFGPCKVKYWRRLPTPPDGFIAASVSIE